MTDPDIFKLDVRVRGRMLKRGRLTEADLKRHLESLADGETGCLTVELGQPALGGHAAARPTGSPSPQHTPDDELEAS